MLNAARNESRELLAKSHADATSELQEAEAKGNRLLEQSRHQATELTNAARAEVEQTLEWARAQAGTVLARAQHGAEQLLAAAGLGEDAIGKVANAIMQAAERVSEQAHPQPPAAAFSGPTEVPPVSPAPPEPESSEEQPAGDEGQPDSES
jgi:cell division septum initiation protein DivIVA